MERWVLPPALRFGPAKQSLPTLDDNNQGNNGSHNDHYRMVGGICVSWIQALQGGHCFKAI